MLFVTLQIFACFFMTGLIWTIQLVHYPSFAFVGDFAPFHRFHSQRITWIVLPVMTLELLTAAWLAYDGPPGPWWINLVGVLLIWAATAFLSVPAHERLGRGFDARVSARLVATNWVRTLLWSARAAGLDVWLYGVL